MKRKKKEKGLTHTPCPVVCRLAPATFSRTHIFISPSRHAGNVFSQTHMRSAPSLPTHALRPSSRALCPGTHVAAPCRLPAPERALLSQTYSFSFLPPSLRFPGSRPPRVLPGSHRPQLQTVSPPTGTCLLPRPSPGRTSFLGPTPITWLFPL